MTDGDGDGYGVAGSRASSGSLRRAPARGFSLPELVMVIAIAGILAALAVPRLYGPGEVAARGFLDESLAAIRHAHKLAMASGCEVQVAVTSGAVSLARRSACGSGGFTGAVPHPARPGNFTIARPGAVTVAPLVTFYYDRIGRPRNGAGALLGTGIDIDIAGRVLHVEAETGLAWTP